MRLLLERGLLGVGMLLWYLGLSGLLRRRRRRVPRVLLYHAIAREEGDFLAGLDSNTTPDQFDRDLAYLARHHTVVSLDALESGNWPDNAAAVTFDDGYRTVFTEALPRLQKRGMPAVLYLITDVVGNDAVVWVNELLWLCHRSGTARLAAAKALGLGTDASAGAIVQAARATYKAERVSELLELVRNAAGRPDALRAARERKLYVTWDEARALAQGGVAIGNHTASHPPLSRLSAEAQEHEMARGHSAIERELGGCTSIAYPFGDYNAASGVEAARTGHRSVMHVGLRRYPQPMAIGRVPVRATSDAALFAELEVVAPFKAWWRERGAAPPVVRQ